MRVIAENEVAHAGIGIDVGVNGLSKLIQTNDLLEKFRHIAESVHNSVVTVTPHLQNNDQLSQFYDDVRKLHHVDSNVHFQSTGGQLLNDEINRFKHQIDKNINFKLVNIDPVNHEMEYINEPAHKDIRFNVDTGEINHVQNTIDRTNSGVEHFRNSLTSTGRTAGSSFGRINRDAEIASKRSSELSDSGKKIHGVFSGSFLGNAFSNVFSTFTTNAESAIKSGFKLVQVGDEAKEAWRHIGLNNTNANDMVKQMDTLRDSAGMDEQSIQQMQKAFYTFTGSAPKARTLVNEVTDFGKASGESNQEIARMGTMLPRMLSTGKVRGQMFNRTFGQSGKLVNALAKASGHSASSFRQLVDSGKMTSQQLQQYMWKASKGSSAALKEYTHTFGGQMTVIKGMWTSSKEQFSHPFVNQLTKSLNQTEKSAGGLPHVQQSVQKISASLGRKFGNQVGKAIGWIVKNQRPLMKTGNALARIIKEMFSGAWKEFSSVVSLIGGHANKSSGSLNGIANALTNISRHTTAMRVLGKVMLTTFAIAKIRQFKRAVFGAGKSMGMLRKVTYAMIHPQETVLKLQEKLKAVEAMWAAIVGPVKAFFTALRAGTGIQVAFDAAMDANPVGAVVVGITAAVGAVTALVIGLRHLYVHCAPARHAMQAIGHVGVMAFKAITWPERMVIKLLGGIVKGIWHATAGLRHKLSGAFDTVKNHASSFYHHSLSGANRLGKETGNWIAGNGHKYRRYQSSNTRAVRNAHASIDRYRHNSSGRFRAYISKDGKIYRSYHKGTTRISEMAYKQREALRNRYYRRYTASLRKYEHNYRAYENKRSSLSRRYGKLRAMYSAKSLALIEERFNGLRKTVVRYARSMYHDTQRIFRRIGTGAGRQFRGIYRSVRRYLRMSNTESQKDFRKLYQDSRKWLNGSINKYVSALRYRYRRQRYYDRQLVKQSKATAESMYRLPLGWITRETKDLIRNWQRQRRSYITHNVRMSHAEVTHLQTMKSHLTEFSDQFRKMMTDMEHGIYDAWSKFWDKMHNRAGSGINSVQAPLNSGAEHINSFVRSFGETSAPMHEMPEVSYATGTGAFRRPITRMVNATLNDGHDSPETHEQETVIHPNGAVEFPQGLNAQETLEPGAEVLNATETKLMSQMAHFAPTVHFATGTGLFGDLFNKMSGWIKSALDGNNNGMSYSSIYSQAKGSGNHKLLHILQNVLKHSTQVLAGFMGNAPSGFKGVLGDITKGIYGQTSNQINQWWKVLMKLTDQALDDGASSSQILNYAEKHWMGVPYVYGATSNSGADCGGAVQSILRHFGINISHTDMEDSPAVRYVGSSESQARPGDLVMFGKNSGSKAGASSHVGIYAGHGQMWNECPPKSTVSSVKAAADADGLWGYYRIKGAPSNNNSLSGIKTNNPLGKFVKAQEAPMLKWIQKHLAPLLAPANPGGTGVMRWKPIIQQAAERMHVHLTDSGLEKILSNIRHESNGDPTVQNNWDSNAAAGDPSVGLVQFIRSTFDHYAVAGHNDIKSGYDQLLALFNDSNWYSDIAPGGGWGPSGSRRLATGGHMNAGEMATVGEQGEELFKPDVSGTVIPHDTTKRIMNNTTNKRPVIIHQHNTYNINGDGNYHHLTKTIDKRQEANNNDLMDKLARMSGLNDDGGLIV